VNDSGTRFPETDAIFVGNIAQEIEHLLVGHLCRLQVGICIPVSLNQVIAMHGRRHCHLFPARVHQLQQGHLGSGILHGHPVGSKVHVIFGSPVILHRYSRRKVSKQNLFSQS
jgi:hypothetical protein